MKKYILITLLGSCMMLFGQNKIAQKVSELQGLNANFTKVSVLTPSTTTSNETVNKVVDQATLATLDTTKLTEIVNQQYDYIELAIPYNNQSVALLLYKVDPFANGFHVDTNKMNHIAYQKGIYYRGMIKDEPNSVASFNFFNGECNGIFSSSILGNVVVGKLQIPNNQSDYIVYSDAKMKVLNSFDCHVKEGTVPQKSENTSAQKNTESIRCATIYFEIDNDLFLANNGDTTQTSNWMTSVFNNVQTLYNNDGITVALKSIYIWTDLDPYQGVGTSSSDYLNAFAANSPVFDGDLGQLIGIDDGGLGGVAVTINGLCSQDNYSYSDLNVSYSSVPTYSWTIQVITHELGHLLGSPHTHACVWNGNNTAIDNCAPSALGSNWEGGECMTTPPTIPSTSEKGTIMSYCHLVSGVGISFNNGFGPQPAALIVDTVNNSTCLSTDCINTCINTVTSIEVTNINTNSAYITWSDMGSGTAWEVSVTPFASTNIVWTLVTQPTYTVTGLNPNTYYKVRVRPLCSGAIAASRNQIFATTNTNLCSYPFTDTGGSSGNYTDMESWVRTMMPTGPGLKVRVTFTSFNLETDYDYLYIYNGPDQYNFDLTNGGLTGTTLPTSTYTSTAFDGSLTFRFYSDQAVNRAGWNATISCTGTLGEVSNDFLDFSYYPNPTSGKVSISSKDAITEIKVFNVQGQLLWSQKGNELTTDVDISKFATGTYFFQLKFNDKQANFKVLKM
jgi:hypothetical protein